MISLPPPQCAVWASDTQLTWSLLLVTQAPCQETMHSPARLLCVRSRQRETDSCLPGAQPKDRTHWSKESEQTEVRTDSLRRRELPVQPETNPMIPGKGESSHMDRTAHWWRDPDLRAGDGVGRSGCVECELRN